MATSPVTTFISVEEYLKTVYRPDVDYVDGQIEERNLGEFDHGTLIGTLYRYFYERRLEWNIRVAVDCRMRVSPTRYRVPDLSIQSLSALKEQVLRTPPILCIEVLSPEDTLRKMRKRVEDYYTLGVAHIWIISFEEREVTICSRDGQDRLQADGLLTVPESPIGIPLEEIFAALDED